MDVDKELDDFNSAADQEKGYKLLLKFDPLFEGEELQLPIMGIDEPKKPITKVVVRNAIRNPKPGLF